MLITVQYPGTCNMDPACPYCYSRPMAQVESGTPEDWLEWLLSIPGGPHHFSFGFGETLQARCMPLYTGLIAAGHQLSLTTNLLCDPAIADGLSLTLCTSWHPHGMTLSEFMLRRQAMTDRGHTVGVALLVGYPPYLQHLAAWQDEFETVEGRRLHVIDYCGTYEGRVYPGAYSIEDREAVHGPVNPRYQGNDEAHNWIVQSPRGQRCWVGVKYLLIDQAGAARACPNDLRTVIGNVQDGLTVPTEPISCGCDRCGCVDMWKFIEVVE
jgi:hypothetical protein